MPNKRWNDIHKGDKDEKTEGAKGSGKVKETKNTYGNKVKFGTEYTDKGDKIGEGM